jgi:nitrate reductase alpha subunit
MSTTCVYSDIVLPTATWYEKNDLNTSDMHPFIHPLARRWIRPGSRVRLGDLQGIAKTFSESPRRCWASRTDVVLTPIQHDTAGELAQPFDVKDWKKGECEPIPGKTMPHHRGRARLPNLYSKRFTSLGPLLDKLGNGGKGIGWNTSTRSTSSRTQRRRA